MIKLKRLKKDKRTEVALDVACELLDGSILYGIDADVLWNKVMEIDGYVSPWNLKEFILKNIDRFSDDEEERNKAIKRLGW